MKRITKIEIENVRGIGEKTQFNLELIPNKPHIVIAPNGTGKTSFARAFASMRARKLTLDDDDRFEKEASNRASVSVHFVDDNDSTQTATADQDSNSIDKVLAVHVICSRVKAKARKFKAGEATAASAEMRVAPIKVARVVEKAVVNYRYNNVVSALGWDRRVTMNLTDLLSSDDALAELPLADLDKITSARLRRLTDEISAAVTEHRPPSVSGWFSSNPSANLVANWVQKHAPDVSDSRLASTQLLVLYQQAKSQFRSAACFASYKKRKAAYRKAADEVSAAAFGEVKIDEDKKSGELRCVFPEASRMSNGERDSVILAIELAVAKTLAGSKPLLVIVDEVFDYLDPGNLIAFQYYITELLNHCKEEGCQVFPVILTHQDAGYFFHSSLGKHKIKELYLHPRRCDRSKETVRLLELREDPQYQETLERDFFHYSDGASAVSASSLPVSLSSSGDFRRYCRAQADAFIVGQKYDAVAVCFALRHEVEKQAHDQLGSGDRPGFLATHTTNGKLEYAEKRGVNIPDSHYLLGFIHNPTLHWKQGRDYVTPLESTMENSVVRSLMERVFKP